MATNFLWQPGTSNNGLLTTAFSLMTSEMNTLTNASIIVSSVGGSSGIFSNSNTAQAVWADLFFKFGAAVGSALSSGANICGWWLTSPDGGTTFEPASGTQAGARPPDFIIPLSSTTITSGNFFKTTGLVRVPALKFKVLVQNNTGQSFPSSGNTLQMAPFALQY